MTTVCLLRFVTLSPAVMQPAGQAQDRLTVFSHVVVHINDVATCSPLPS